MRIIKLAICHIILGFCVVCICACGGNPVQTNQNQLNIPDQNEAGACSRTVLAMYDAVINPQDKTFTITPSLRKPDYHFNLNGSYTRALTVTGYGWIPNFRADIKLKHPFPGSGIDAYDPRVIAVIPAREDVNMFYPVMNVKANNKAIIDPDGYTKMFDEVDYGIVGNANPFKAYFKNQPYRVWTSTGVSEETQRWNINLDGFNGSMVFKLVVDISTNYPNPPQPVVDNAPEAVKIDADVEYGLSPTGGNASIDVTVLDWQGRSTIRVVQVECPGLFNGTVNLTYSNPGSEPNEYVYTGIITNELQNQPGEYKLLVKCSDFNSSYSAYNEFPLQVTGEIPFNPTLVKSLDFPNGLSYLQVEGKYVYIPATITGVGDAIRIIDIDPPEEAYVINTIPVDDFKAFKVKNGYMYLVSSSSLSQHDFTFNILSIDDPPSTFQMIKQFEISGPLDMDASVCSMEMSNEYVCLTCNWYASESKSYKNYVIDVYPRENAHICSNFESGSCSYGRSFIKTNGKYIFTNSYWNEIDLYPHIFGSNFNVWSMADPENPARIKQFNYQMEYREGLGCNDDYVFLFISGDGYQTPGFEVYDVTPPEETHLVKTVLNGSNTDMKIIGNYLYTLQYTSNFRGLAIYKLNLPQDVVPVASLAGFPRPGYMEIQGHYAYIADWDTGLRIVKLW